ncbi:MAG: response regulator transcription factor [Bacillota bacterium]
MLKKRILVVDDEPSITELVKLYLEKEDYDIRVAHNGTDALAEVENDPPDLIVLDVMLPDINGVDLCLDIRKHHNMPILFLSCKDQEIDKIVALSVGGDDYITKPFLPGEMVARVKANLRRSNLDAEDDDADQIYTAPGLVVNSTTREVLSMDEPISLTAKEFDILLLLIKNPKRIYSAEQLFEHVWKEETLRSDRNTIMVYISNLRKKIEIGEYKYILNIRGLGYKFNHHLFDE